MWGYEVKITLSEFSPVTSREFIIPENYSFEEFSNVINIILGFSGNQESLFVIRPYNDIIKNKNVKSLLDVTYDTNTTYIKEFFDELPDLDYLYDMEDRWLIGIEINGKVECKQNYPIVTDFKGVYNPLEGCGGVWELTEIIYYAKKPSARDNSRNAKLSFEIKKFNLKEVNKKLKKIKYS